MTFALALEQGPPPNMYGLHGYTKSRKRDQAVFSAQARRFIDELTTLANMTITPGCEVQGDEEHASHHREMEELLGQISVARQSLEASVGERRFRGDLRRFAPSLLAEYQSLRLDALDRLAEHEAFLRDVILGESDEAWFPEADDEPALGPSVPFEM